MDPCLLVVLGGGAAPQEGARVLRARGAEAHPHLKLRLGARKKRGELPLLVGAGGVGGLVGGAPGDGGAGHVGRSAHGVGREGEHYERVGKTCVRGGGCDRIGSCGYLFILVWVGLESLDWCWKKQEWVMGGTRTQRKKGFYRSHGNRQNTPTAAIETAGLRFDRRRRCPPDISDDAFNARGSAGDCIGRGVCSVSSTRERPP